MQLPGLLVSREDEFLPDALQFDYLLKEKGRDETGELETGK